MVGAVVTGVVAGGGVTAVRGIFGGVVTPGRPVVGVVGVVAAGVVLAGGGTCATVVVVTGVAGLFLARAATPAAAAPRTSAMVIAAMPAADRQPAPPTLPRAAAPQFRHQSCSGAIACPQLEQTGPAAGAGASAPWGASPSGVWGSDCFDSAG